MAPRVQQHRRGLLGTIIAIISWLHSLTVRPLVHFYNNAVLGSLEESISSLIRESLALTQRTLNGVSASVLSVFNRGYKQQLRGRWQELADLHSWWREDKKHSTLNAVLARNYGESADGGRQTGGPAQADLPHPRISSSSSLRHRAPSGQQLHPGAAGAGGGSSSSSRVATPAISRQPSDAAIAAATGVVPLAGKHDTGGAAGEIEPASDDEQQQQAQLQLAGGSDADEQESTQWWQQGAALLPSSAPAWLAAMSEEAQEAAAAAQEAASAATAAVQQAASSVSTAAQQAVEEAAAAAAALARNMRAVFEQQPAGWSVDEAIRGRTGLLEDVSLFSQLLVTRIFDAIRRVIGCITLTPTTPTAGHAAALRPRGSGLSHAAASGTASPRCSIAGRISSSGVGGASKSTTAAAERRGTAPTTMAGAGADGSGSRGIFGLVGRLLWWPFSKGSTSEQLSAGAATAGASKWAGAGGGRQWGGGGVRSPTALKRRSATSIDLPRATRMWMSDSEDDSSSEDESSVSDDHIDLQAKNWAATDGSAANAGFWTAATAAQAGTASSLSPTKQPLKPSLSVSSTSRTGSLTGGQAGKLGHERNRAAEVVTGLSLNRVAFAGAERVDQSSDSERARAADAPELQLGAAAAVSPKRTPFASSPVQEKHHSVISRDEWAKQHRVQQPASPHTQPANQPESVQDKQRQKQRRRASKEDQRQASWGSGGVSSIGSAGSGTRSLQRSHSGPATSELRDVSSAGQVIRMAGYPLEVHEVQTTDGYLLRMERIPQQSSTDVVFMMHGVLDTSLTWVAGGITGSQAFAAWDRGFDVWLGTSRSNPPHTAADPKLQGSAYWRYTNNEVGMYDMGAQIDHIHTTRMRELAALGIATGHRTARVSVSSMPSTPRGAATATRVGSSSAASQSTAPATAAAESPADAAFSESPAQIPGLPSMQPEIAASYSIAHAAHADSAPDAGGSALNTSTAAQDAAAFQQNLDLHLQQYVDAADDFTTPLSSGYTTPTGTMLLSPSGVMPIVAAEQCNSGRVGLRLGRAESAAEADAAAAAEAAIALSRYRAAAAAAGVSQPAAKLVVSDSLSAAVSSTAMTERFWWGRGSQRKSSRDVLLGRRAGSLDMDSAAAAAAAAAASAAAAAVSGGAGAVAAARAAGAAALVAAAVGCAREGGSSRHQQQETEEQHASESPCSSQGSTPCTVHIIGQGHQGGTVADHEGNLHTEALHAKRAAAAAAWVDQIATTADAFGQSVWRRLGSSSSMRHVSSAPDVTALSVAREEGANSPAGGSSSSNDQSAAGGHQVNGGYASAGSSNTGAHSGYVSAVSSNATSSARSTQDDVAAAQAPEQDAAAVQPPPQQLSEPVSQTTRLAIFRCSSSSSSRHGDHTESASHQSLPTQQSAVWQIMAEVQEQQAERQQQGLQNQQQPQQQQTAALLSPRASRPPSSAGSGQLAEPYNLRVVGHSLGGFLMLIYCIQRQREGRAHHVRRLILLSPAGFHPVIPAMFKPVVYVWRPLMWYMTWIWRQQAFPVHLPTFVARMLAFKLTLDTSKLPAVGDLVRSFARFVLGGDRSAWDRTLLMPHYTAAGMPLLSSFQVMHFIQLYIAKRCQLYDYGSTAANVAAYQQPTPPSISDCYHALRDVPVHLVAGLHDGVIPPVNIQRHFETMQAAGVDVTYREFDYGHMDFTFSAKEELGYYVSGLLMRK